MKHFFEVLTVVVVFAALVWRLNTNKPAEVHVDCQTTKGSLEIVVQPDWSPRGADRFLELVRDGFFTNLSLFRCIENFVCQVGAKTNGKKYSSFPDDNHRSDLRYFKKGYMSFAGSGPNTRANHIFIALGEAPSLGSQPWETPFAYITATTYDSTVDHFTTKYGEMAPMGTGPDGHRIEASDGEQYLKTNFPDLDYFVSCSIRK